VHGRDSREQFGEENHSISTHRSAARTEEDDNDAEERTCIGEWTRLYLSLEQYVVVLKRKNNGEVFFVSPSTLQIKEVRH